MLTIGGEPPPTQMLPPCVPLPFDTDVPLFITGGLSQPAGRTLTSSFIPAAQWPGTAQMK
jgi:hypothetical protein